MNTAQKWQAGRVGYEEQRLHFILAELDLALTFAQVALASRNSDTRQRNIGHAQRAYHTAIHQVDAGPLTTREERTVRAKVHALQRTFKKFPLRDREVLTGQNQHRGRSGSAPRRVPRKEDRRPR